MQHLNGIDGREMVVYCGIYNAETVLENACLILYFDCVFVIALIRLHAQFEGGRGTDSWHGSLVRVCAPVGMTQAFNKSTFRKINAIDLGIWCTGGMQGMRPHWPAHNVAAFHWRVRVCAPSVWRVFIDIFGIHTSIKTFVRKRNDKGEFSHISLGAKCPVHFVRGQEEKSRNCRTFHFS